LNEYKIISVTAENVDEYGFFCVKNKTHPGYIAKLEWLQKRFKEGLKIKLIKNSDNKTAGFIEYIPGEHTWRVINAPDYYIIHCLWVSSNKFSFKGMASDLINDCVEDARANKKAGVAVVTSDGPWMAGKEVYIKNGFEIVDETRTYFQLMVMKTGKAKNPSFPTNWDQRLKKFDGLQIVYTNQCPYIGKAIEELPPVAKKYGVNLKLVELKNSKEAREKMPLPYGVVNFLYNGKLLSDHPISATRFKNILQKDFKLNPR
jgi:hypothetical protein